MTRTPTRLALGLLLSGTLAACSQAPAPSPTADDSLPPGSPYANGAAYPWSDRLEEPIADPYAAGRDYPWTSPQAASTLDTQGLNAGVNQLSDLPWTSASSFWGPIERNRSNGEQGASDGRTLTIGGQTFSKGLGVHADSTVKYALNAQCSTLNATIGIDDEVGTRGRVTFQVLGDGKVLYTSPELTGADTARAITVPLTGVKELTLNVLKGVNTYYDHSDWADAKVTCQALKPSGTVFVSDLAYTAATSGWGPIEIDRSNGEQKQSDGRPLTVNGQVFQKGLGVHAASTITYTLGGACQTFTATGGIDDETLSRGSVTFQVYGDGAKLYDSGIVRPHDGAPATILADVTGVQVLKLVVTDAGDGKFFDHADWADAKLGCAAAGSPGTADGTFGTAGHANVGGVDSVVQPDNSVVLLGADFSVRRLSPSGTPSATGGATVPGGVAVALARQSSGNLIAVGHANGAVVAVRYLPNLQPDPTFGTGGVVTAQFGQSVFSDQSGVLEPASSVPSDVTVQPDGKVVIVGKASGAYRPIPTFVYPTPDFLVARLTSAGQPDPSFGTAGAVVIPGESLSVNQQGAVNDNLTAVALQADGRIVAAGASEYISAYSPLVFRFLSSGQLDATFGVGGLTSVQTQGGYGDLLRAILVEPAGTIVVGGATERFQTKAVIARLTATGAPAGGTIFQIADSFVDQGSVYSLARQGDGKVVFGASTPNNLSVGRLNADLTPDTTFGSLGTGYVSFNQAVTSVNVDAAGRIVASGMTDTVRLLP